MRPSLEERFWANTRKAAPDQCWLWVGRALKKDGRGSMTHQNRHVTAPRVSWYIHHGAWPGPGLFACHSCDNPACVNPDHLWLGTVRDNALDAQAKGRLAGQSLTHCKHGHPFEGANVFFNKRGQRQCSTCRDAYRKTVKMTPAQRARKSELQRLARAKARAALGDAG